MAGWKVMLGFLLLVLVYRAAEAENSSNSSETGPSIPQQCIDNTVTPVSCENDSTEDGLLPHPDDCALFYYCVSPDSLAICRKCPANLHFNPKKKVCDLPKNAGCESKNGNAKKHA